MSKETDKLNPFDLRVYFDDLLKRSRLKIEDLSDNARRTYDSTGGGKRPPTFSQVISFTHEANETYDGLRNFLTSLGIMRAPNDHHLHLSTANTFGAKLTSYREETGLSVNMLGTLAGVDAETVRRAESGAGEITAIASAVKIINTLYLDDERIMDLVFSLVPEEDDLVDVVDSV